MACVVECWMTLQPNFVTDFKFQTAFINQNLALFCIQEHVFQDVLANCHHGYLSPV